MVHIEIENVTGWEVVDPEGLKSKVDKEIQRMEQNDEENIVVLYFDFIP